MGIRLGMKLRCRPMLQRERDCSGNNMQDFAKKWLAKESRVHLWRGTPQAYHFSKGQMLLKRKAQTPAAERTYYYRI